MSVDPKAVPERVHQEHDGRPAFDFRRLSEFGVLWLINRVVFHPRGFALVLEYEDGNPEPIGWSLQGDGSETFRFEGFDEDEKFWAFEELLTQAREHGKAPHFTAMPPPGDSYLGA